MLVYAVELLSLLSQSKKNNNKTDKRQIKDGCLFVSSCNMKDFLINLFGKQHEHEILEQGNSTFSPFLVQ